MSQESINKVIDTHRSRLMSIPGVVGIGEGKYHDVPCIVVFVTDKESPSIQQIPENINGFLVKIEESGVFRSLK